MSIVSLSSGEPTCTLDDLHATAKANNFAIDRDSLNEAAFLLFANSFDAVCDTINSLPDYDDPRLTPRAVQGKDRKYYRPDEEENPLNGWAYKTSLKVPDAKGPLLGRTVVFKDNMSVAGLPLGLGCSPSLLENGEHPISKIDATVVQRILDAGATVKGTATCENLSLFPLSYTSHSGVVHNAWLPTHATGGSSSGCGVLVSIGDVEDARKNSKDGGEHPLGEGVDMAMGGDQGGSVRLPAAYSGIYGLKPTHGLVPYTGIATLNPMIDHTGPMARTVEDIALMLNITAGYDGMDLRMTPESPMSSQVQDYLGHLNAWVASKETRGEWTAQSAGKGLRVGILKESFEVVGLDPVVCETVKLAARRFESLGAELKELTVPMHTLGASIWTVCARPMMPHFMAGKAPDLLSHTMPGLKLLPIDQKVFDTLANKNPGTVNVFMNASYMEKKYGPALAKKAMMHAWELRAAYDEALAEVDVLLTPVNATVAPKLPPSAHKTAENPQGMSERIMDLIEPTIGSTLNVCPFNLTGHPAMSMPVGRGKVKDGEGKLPIGMQLVAKRYDEASIFKAAKVWEVGGKWTES